MINPGLFFLFILLIIPGYLALMVYNNLITKSREKDSFWDITYNSVIHSLFIYIIIYLLWYPHAYAHGIHLLNEDSIISFLAKTPWRPLQTVSAIIFTSILYGIIYGLIYRFNLLQKFLSLFFKRVVEPPNILADIIDTKYGTEPMFHWLTFKHDNILYSGAIKIAKLDHEPREFLLEHIQILDTETREPLFEYPKDEHIWVKLTDSISLLSIKSVPKKTNE